MNVSHFVEICQVLTILHQLICRGVTNFGTRCRWLAVDVGTQCNIGYSPFE